MRARFEADGDVIRHHWRRERHWRWRAAAAVGARVIICDADEPGMHIEKAENPLARTESDK
jgi:hypothetical protein